LFFSSLIWPKERSTNLGFSNALAFASSSSLILSYFSFSFCSAVFIISPSFSWASCCLSF
jgi:hypothetical protein